MSVAPRQSVPVFTAAALAGALVAAAPLLAAAVPQKGGDKTAYVIAVGPDNKPLAGMTKDEFAIREDGADRAITSAKQATDPIDMFLIIDVSHQSNASIAILRTGLAAFAKTIFAGPSPVNMTIIDSAGASIAVAENKKSLEEVQKPLEKTFADQTSNPTILEAISDAAKKLAKSTTPRRAIVVVNLDGVGEASSLKSQDVMLTIMGSGASLWCVTYQNQDTKNLSQSGQGPSGRGGVNSAGANTGGGVGTGNVGQSREYVLVRAPALGGLRASITTPTELPDILTSLASLIVGQYAVTYTRPDGPQPKQFMMGTTREGAKVGFNQVPVK
jgi:hypothetical protein